jgi:hypothetical protein
MGHKLTNLATFELQFGSKPHFEIRKLLKLSDVPAENQLATIQWVYKRKAKQRKDRVRAMNMKFEAGDLVLLKANNISSEYGAEIQKFLLLYERPFQVKKRIQTGVYVLMYQHNQKERGTFHVSNMKPFYDVHRN